MTTRGQGTQMKKPQWLKLRDLVEGPDRASVSEVSGGAWRLDHLPSGCWWDIIKLFFLVLERLQTATGRCCPRQGWWGWGRTAAISLPGARSQRGRGSCQDTDGTFFLFQPFRSPEEPPMKKAQNEPSEQKHNLYNPVLSTTLPGMGDWVWN